ncbi:Gag polyprotein [Bienertia sinuspersici]
MLQMSDCYEISGDEVEDTGGTGPMVMVHFWHGGNIEYGLVDDYVGGQCHSIMIEKVEFDYERLMEELKKLGYVNVMMLWFRIPGVGAKSGGLRPLFNEASFKELQGYVFDEGIVNIYALHKVDKPEIVSIDELGKVMNQPRKKLTPVGGKGKLPAEANAQSTGTSSQANIDHNNAEATAAKEAKVVVEECLSDELPSSGHSYDDDDSAEDESYKMNPKEMEEAYVEDEWDINKGKGKKVKRDANIGRQQNETVEEDDVNDDVDGNEYEHNYESDDSVPWDDILEEELQYDDHEMRAYRADSIGKRRADVGSKWSEGESVSIGGGTEVQAEETHEEEGRGEAIDNTDTEVFANQTNLWPSYWTTFEGGYNSDQRDSENEDPCDEDDDEDTAIEIHKRRKTEVYPTFNEKTDMFKVQLVVGQRFTSRHIFKQAILAYSIQQHKDLVYLKNDKRFISIGCANCRWELTSGPDLDDSTGWQIKSMQPLHERCTRTFKNRLITEHWLVNEFLDKILRNPLMKAIEMKEDMKVRYDIVVGLRKCQRDKLVHLWLTLLQELVKNWRSLMRSKPVPGKTFWNHEGEGLVFPPDIIRKGPGKKKTARRKDGDEPSKGKVKYNRKGLPSKCSNCGQPGHHKNKCKQPQQQKPPSSNVAAKTWARGRKKGSKNRVGRPLPDLVQAEVPTPSTYQQQSRKGQGTAAATTGRGAASSSTGWLQAARGRGRGKRGRGTSRGRGTPVGIGLIYGEGGTISFSGSGNEPPVVISHSQMSSQPTQ